jgi:hypothetical protein
MLVNIRKFKTGELYPLEIAEDISVERLKSTLWIELLVTPLQQCLVVHGKKLEEDMYVSDYPIKSGDVIHLLEREVEQMKILVYSEGHHKLKITVNSNTFIDDLRAVIQKLLQETRGFRMELRGKELDDCKILGDYPVRCKSKIIVTFD